MSCGINQMRDRVTVTEMQKVEDVAGGFTLNSVELHTIWAYVDHKGFLPEEIGDRVIRVDKYEVTARVSPVIDDKPDILTLKFTINGTDEIYPKSYKTTSRDLVVFKCTNRHEG